MTIASAPQPGNKAPSNDALDELVIAAASGKGADQLYDTALEYVSKRLGADAASILALGGGGALRCKASRGLSPDYVRAIEEQPLWAAYAMAPEPLLAPDVGAEPSLQVLAGLLEREGVRGAAFFPLVIGAKPLGQLTIYHFDPYAWRERDVLTARAVAALIAVAMNQEDDRERDQRFRKLIERLGVAVYTTDAEGTITFYNEEAAVLWGRRPLVGVDRWCGSEKLFWPDGTPMPFEDSPMAVALRERRLVRGHEAVAERPDGTRVTFVPYPSPFIDAMGNLIGAVNVLVDVTRRRHAETALKMKEATLVAALADKEQTNAALQRVAMDLSIANAAKDEFLSLVSHELKTPLTTIWGNATILFRARGEVDAETARAALGDIVSESERLHRIIENLLLLARAEQGQPLEAEPLIVKRVVERVVERHRQQQPDRRFEILEQGDPRLVVFSEAFLEQVTENLISNAEKYSPVAEPIVIELERDDREVHIRVLDRGIGVQDEELERLFDAFYRSGSVKGRSEGLGIGLAVCKRLVETQGGRIWAKRRPQGGSEFGFALPIIDDSDMQADEP